METVGKLMTRREHSHKGFHTERLQELIQGLIVPSIGSFVVLGNILTKKGGGSYVGSEHHLTKQIII